MLAGFMATFLLSVGMDAAMHLSGWFPPFGQPMSEVLFIFAAGYRGLFTIAGGYVTASLAPDRPMVHAGVLATIGLLAGSAGLLAYYQSDSVAFGPAWYAYSIPLMAIPCVLAEGALWKLRNEARLEVER